MGNRCIFKSLRRDITEPAPKGPFAQTRSRTSPSSDNIYHGTGMAYMVERLTWKPGAILTRVRIPGADFVVVVFVCLVCFDFVFCCFLSQVHFQCRLSYDVYTAFRVQSKCINVWIPNMAAITLFGHTERLHLVVGMGSAALAAAVPFSGKATRMSHKGKLCTDNSSKRNKNYFVLLAEIPYRLTRCRQASVPRVHLLRLPYSVQRQTFCRL